MLNSKKLGIEIYQNLGKLFYAVAMADGTTHVKELNKLKEIVRQEWIHVDRIEDNFQSDAAYQIETVFDWLLEKEINSEDSFKEFSDFYKEYPELFTKPIKSLIMQTANAIAFSFAGKNKSELIVMAKIALLFKK